jgi:hypothetical protein
VRGVGDELLAGAVELGQPPLHFVEGAGQRRQLPDRGDRDRRFEVAVGDFAGRVLEAADVADRLLGVVEAEQGGERRGDQAADDDLQLDVAETAGAAGDRNRVDVDDRDGAEADGDRRDRDPAAEGREPQPPQGYSLKR